VSLPKLRERQCRLNPTPSAQLAGVELPQCCRTSGKGILARGLRGELLPLPARTLRQGEALPYLPPSPGSGKDLALCIGENSAALDRSKQQQPQRSGIGTELHNPLPRVRVQLLERCTPQHRRPCCALGLAPRRRSAKHRRRSRKERTVEHSALFGSAIEDEHLVASPQQQSLQKGHSMLCPKYSMLCPKLRAQLFDDSRKRGPVHEHGVRARQDSNLRPAT
jgi:hypothetical protein